MPDLSDFDILDLTGMDFEDVTWSGQKIGYDFGDGYGAQVVTGSPGGLHVWNIFSGCLPGDVAYSNLIQSKARWDYYFDFFVEHTTGGKRVFEVSFRGKRYHAAFVDSSINARVFSYDLFGECTLAIKQQKVPGIVYDTDNSILEIENIPGLYSWHRADFGWDGTEGTWDDQSGNEHGFSRAGSTQLAVSAGAQNGHDILQFNLAANNTFLETGVSPTVFDMFLVMKMREAAFSNDCGLVTTDAAGAVAVLLGDSGETKFQNIAISDFEYRLDGSTYAQSNQQAPMNRFGVVHLRFLGSGFTLTNLQFGKDRGTAGTFAELDLAEIIIVEDALLSTALMQRVTAYLINYWDTV